MFFVNTWMIVCYAKWREQKRDSHFAYYIENKAITKNTAMVDDGDVGGCWWMLVDVGG